MKKVLIVDDDAVSRGLLARVMKPYSSDFEVLTAKDGAEAADLMTRQAIDLIISDLQMPIMDGFQLLEYIDQNFPGTPVFLMTAFSSKETEEKAYALGAFKYFEKPLNMDVLTDAIFEQLNSGAEGAMAGISLASFLQLLEMERKTCTLKITAADKVGTMYFRDGSLINASTDQVKGLQAAFEMLSWDQIRIEVLPICRKKDRVIRQPLMNILMEGLKIKDEKDQKSRLRPLTDFSSRKTVRKLK
ncbi:MAG: response regulator [Thermodesulfobacteriota bacterium]